MAISSLLWSCQFGVHNDASLNAIKYTVLLLSLFLLLTVIYYYTIDIPSFKYTLTYPQYAAKAPVKQLWKWQSLWPNSGCQWCSAWGHHAFWLHTTGWYSKLRPQKIGPPRGGTVPPVMHKSGMPLLPVAVRTWKFRVIPYTEKMRSLPGDRSYS